jgi:hypothetical protein
MTVMALTGPERRHRWAWAAFGLWVALLFTQGALTVATGGSPDSLAWAILNAGFPLAAILILSRQPANRIGWILMIIGLLTAEPLGAYGSYALSRDLPGGALAIVLHGVMWAPQIVTMGAFLLLRFPDGRLPTRRWRWVEWLAGATLLGAVLILVLTPGDLADLGYPGIPKPLGIDALADVLNTALAALTLIPLVIVLSAASLVVRFRRSRGAEREQLKWLTASAGVVAVVYLLAQLASQATGSMQGDTTPAWLGVLQAASSLVFIVIPLAIGIAILRYRLYDIDRIISRTLAYAILTLILGATFAGLVLGLQALARPITGSSQAAVAVSTLAVAALFGPLRARVQAAVDRRFNRSRYDAARLSEELAARLRDHVDLDGVRGELVQTTDSAFQPTSISVWVRNGHGPEPG